MMRALLQLKYGSATKRLQGYQARAYLGNRG